MAEGTGWAAEAGREEGVGVRWEGHLCFDCSGQSDDGVSALNDQDVVRDLLLVEKKKKP